VTEGSPGIREMPAGRSFAEPVLSEWNERSAQDDTLGVTMRWISMSALWAVALLITAPTAVANDGPTRLDPMLRIAAQEATVTPALSKHLSAKAAVNGKPVVSIFVKTTDPAEATKIIEQWDGHVRSTIGNILTANLPLEYVADLSRLDIIEYVEADKPMRYKLNQSLGVATIDTVHSGTGLSAAYKGTGVIVGIVDSGIDCDHADFNDDSGSSRLLAYWDQTIGTSGVSEISSSTGTEYTGSGIGSSCATSSPDGDSAGHGTHVAGIAVGNDATFKGAAPLSTIVAVKHNAQDADSGGSFATTVTDAVNYIFKKAQAQDPKKPAVVNLSLGTSLGAHDGTSLFEQSLDALLVESGTTEKQGRAIVNAAGNENLSSADSGAATFAGIHATVSQTSAQRAYDFTMRSAATVFTTFGGAIVDIWLNSTSDCTIQIDAYSFSGKTSSDLKIDMSPVTKGSSTSADSNTDGTIKIALDFTDSSNANNSKQHAVATITKVSGASVSSTTYSFDLLFIGSCTGDAWLYPDLTAATAFRKASALSVATNPRGYTYVSGNSDFTMTVPSTANKVIAVGSFMGAGTWTDLNGTVHDQTSTSEGTGGTAGSISLFSSLGPTPDGRTKPDLSAPGEPIISTLASTVTVSSSNKGDSTHHKLEGSSMSSPHVAGLVALMLERSGCLTATEIKTLLQANATSDTATGVVPNDTYGSGKLAGNATVGAVTAASCVPNNPSENITATSSGSSCSLIVRD
jgi:minor extracellular serine protease Vpr